MKTRALMALVAVAGTAAAATAQSGTATYSIAFGSAGGPNTVNLLPGQSTDVFVNVAWTTTGTPTPIGLSDGAFGITGTGTGSGTWAVDGNTASATYSLPNPWGAQGAGGLGVTIGTPSGNNVGNVNWGYGFLFAAPHPFPQNPANVWRGKFTAGGAGVLNLSTTGLSGTGVFAGTTGIPTVLTFQSVAGTGVITIVPAPASLALLGLGGLVAARRRR